MVKQALDREPKKGSAELLKVLAAQRRGWRQFVEAIHRITEIEYA